MRFKKGLGNVALAIVATVLSLAAAEVVLALLLPESNLRTTAGLNIFTADPELGYRLQSNVYRRFRWLERDVTIVTDRDGHRIAEAERSVARSAPVVVVAGDSYVFGNEVQAEETFPYLLGNALRIAPVNLGVGGYSLDQSGRALARYLARPRSDSVGHALLVLFIGNDLEWGVAPKPPRVDLNGFLIDAGSSAPDTGTQVRLWLSLNSRVAFLAGKVHAELTMRRQVVRGSVTPAASAPAPTPATVQPARRRWIYDENRYTNGVLDGHQAVFASVKRAADLASVPLTIVLLPEREQVTGTLGDTPNRKLQAVLAEAGLPVIDLLPSMREAHARSGKSFYHEARFGHFSVEGHRLVAALLAQRLSGIGDRGSGIAVAHKRGLP